MTKSVYTEAVVTDIVGRYTDLVGRGAEYAERSALVLEMADELEVSENSVRSKLTAEKVYVAKVEAKTEAGATSKEAYAKALSAIVGVELKSISKATKADLKAIVDYVTKASAVADAEAGRKEGEGLTEA
jgi:hypothetical protein